jgi:hypothetical protein
MAADLAARVGAQLRQKYAEEAMRMPLAPGVAE